MRFVPGDHVFYVSGAHGKSKSNPLKGSSYECAGVVTEADDHNLAVCWDNGTRNTYNHSDLEYEAQLDPSNPNCKFRMKRRSFKIQ